MKGAAALRNKCSVAKLDCVRGLYQKMAYIVVPLIGALAAV